MDKKRKIRSGIAPIPTNKDGIAFTSDGSVNAITNGGSAMSEKLQLEEIINESGPTLNLRRNGFVIAPEENFSDDGNYFRGYYYDPDKTGDKRFVASKLISNGDAYISVSYYDPNTGKTHYFDDLNGVDYQYAIDHIKDLTDKLDAFKSRLDSGEIKPAQLTDDQIKQIKDKAVDIASATGDGYISIIPKLLKKIGIEDPYDLPMNLRDALYKDVERSIRNSKEDNALLVKTFAKEALTTAIRYLKSEYSYDYKGRGTRREALSVEDAIDKALYDTSISTYSGYKDLVQAGIPEDNIYYFKGFTDATQEKIRNWMKNKLDNLFDFE